MANLERLEEMFAGRVYFPLVHNIMEGKIGEFVKGLVLVIEQDAVLRFRDPWRCHILRRFGG